MKKSLLALFLVLVMCASIILTSCSSNKEDEKEPGIEVGSATAPLTLTLYAPTDGSTTPEQVEVVQAAFSAITKSKFNANIVLKLIPDDKYEETINNLIEKIVQKIAEDEAAEESRFQANLEAIQKGETLPPEETEAPETSADGENSPETQYPEEKENQLDIFLVRSFETYYNLVKNEHLSALDEDLASGAKLLNSYVYPYLLRAAKVEGETFGIFNNTVFGDYKYMLLNKELIDKYDYDPEVMNDIHDISYFLQEIKQKEPDVIPFLGDIEAPVLYYENQPSLLGAFIPELSTNGTIDALSYLPTVGAPKNLLSATMYTRWLREYNTLEQLGCFVEKTDANKNAKFAATIIDGDASLSPTYADVYGNFKTDKFGFKYVTIDGTDYYISVYRRPVASNDEIFNAGFVVSAYTEDVSRCMDIITALNTDATLSNLLMYGVEEVHYVINEDSGLVHRITDEYSMNIEHIGNIFLLKQSDDMSEYWTRMSNNGWQNAKNANREAILHPFTSFVYEPEVPSEDSFNEGGENAEKEKTTLTFKEVVLEIQKMSPEILRELLKFKVVEGGQTYSMFLASVMDRLNNDPYMVQVNSLVRGVYYLPTPYAEWYKTHYGKALPE